MLQIALVHAPTLEIAVYPEYRPEYLATVTAYTKRCKGCTGITASGKKAEGAMLAASSVWKFGTCLELYLHGWKQVIVEDRGAAIQGKHRFDLLMASKKDAQNFGRQQIRYRRCDD